MRLFRKNKKEDNEADSSNQEEVLSTDHSEIENERALSGEPDPSIEEQEESFPEAPEEESSKAEKKKKKKGFFSRFRKKSQDVLEEEEQDETESEEPVEEFHDEVVRDIEEELPDHDTAGPEEESLEAHEEDEREEDFPEEKKQGFLKRLRNGLSKTRKAFANRVDSLVLGKKEIDEDLLEELEEVLITSDIGVHTSLALIDEVREQVASNDLSNPEELKDALHNKILEFVKVPDTVETAPLTTPHVIMVVGVNGVGKTTTIGKIAARLVGEGKKVLLVAADTFRAAAVEQLEIWSERVDADIIRHKGKADPSAVAYDGMQAAISRKVDVAIIDTAGRLHTKVNLMEELKKMGRTIKKQLPDAPHETLLVLDATTGQNAISQAQLFHETTKITGIVLTKLDGTAKGGVVVGICHSLGIPLKYIGFGEKVDDLQPFDPDAFMKALF